MKLVSNHILAILITLSIIFLLTTSNVKALEPSFNLVVVPDKAEYNPQDNVTLYVLIDGTGKINGGYLYVYVPNYLYENKTLTFIDYGVACATPYNPLPNNECCAIVTNSAISHPFIDSTTVGINSGYFGYDCNGGDESGRYLLTNKFVNGENPMMQIKFNVNKNAPSGDNFAYLSFNYKYENKTYLLTSQPQIKVTNIYERHIWSLTIIGLIIAGITLVSIAKSFKESIEMIISYLKKMK